MNKGRLHHRIAHLKSIFHQRFKLRIQNAEKKFTRAFHSHFE